MPKTTQKCTAMTRNRILDAAEYCFCKFGVTHTTMARIAKHGHFTRGVIYWHFYNKENLLNAVIQRRQLSLFEEMENAINITDGSPIDVLHQHLTQFVRHMANDYQVRSMLEIMMQQDDNKAHNIHLSQLKQHHIERALRLIADCVEKLNVHYPKNRQICSKTYAQLIHFSLIGVVNRCLMDPSNTNLINEAISALDLIFDLLKTSQPPKAA